MKRKTRGRPYAFPKRIKLCTMKIYEIENQITFYENMNQVTEEKLMPLYSRIALAHS